jgi:hypothetical protein
MKRRPRKSLRQPESAPQEKATQREPVLSNALDPFAVFAEWSSVADEKAYADL